MWCRLCVVLLSGLLARVQVSGGSNLTIGVCGDMYEHATLPTLLDVFDLMQKSEEPLRNWKHIGGGQSTGTGKREHSFFFNVLNSDCDYQTAHQIGMWLMLGRAPVDVILGCSCSAASDSVARVGTIMKTPQISFSSGATYLSTNKVFYKYFMRTLVPLQGMPGAMVHLLEAFGWTAAKLVTLSDPQGNLIEEDFFYEAAGIAEGRGIEIRPIWLDVAAIRSELHPVNGSCTAPLELSSDGASCVDLAQWREAIHNSRAFPELIHILYIKDAPFLTALRLALDEGLFRHVWIFDKEGSWRAERGIEHGTLEAISGSLELQPLPPNTSVWRKFRDFAGNYVGSSFEFSGGGTQCGRPPSPPCETDEGDGGSQGSLGRDYVSNIRVPLDWQDEDARGDRSEFSNAFELVDALLTIYSAYDELADQGVQDEDIRGELLHKTMMALSLDGAMGLVSFNDRGDRATSNLSYAILNFQGGAPMEVARLDASGIAMLPGQEFVWPGNTTDRPTGRAPDCGPGAFYDGLECKRCRPGEGLVMTLSAEVADLAALCQPCSPGSYSTIGICQPCHIGRWSSEGATSCIECDAGRYAESYGTSSCTWCEEGFFTGSNGSTTCTACAVGRFAASRGSVECEECPVLGKMTTQDVGAQALSECVCFSGYFHSCAGDTCVLGATDPSTPGFCQPCLTGMDCMGERDAPTAMVSSAAGQRRHKPPYLRSGTMAIGETAYLCGKEADGPSCPGGDMGANFSFMCAPHSSGIACAECANGYLYSEGECAPCGVAGAVGVSLLIVAAVVCLTLLFAFTFPREPIGTLTNVTFDGVVHTDVISNTCAAAINLMQTTWLFAKAASIKWPASSRAMFQGSGSAWDLSIFGLECFYGGTPKSYAVARTVVLNTLPAFPCSILVFAWLIGRLGRIKATGRKYFPDHCLACSMGLSILSTFFLVIANSAINTGFADFPHPGGHRSLSFFPYLLTTDSEVSVIRAVSVCGIAVWCALGMTWVTILLLQLPAKIKDPGFRRSTMSITSRYRPENPWWFLVQMIHNLLIAMSPSLFMAGDSQVGWMSFVFAVYSLLLLSFRPYFCPVTYYCDVTCSLGKLLILLLVVPFNCAGEGGLLITFIAAMVYAIAVFECLYAAQLWARYNFMGKTHDITKEWDDLGGHVVRLLRLPYTGHMMDMVQAPAPAADPAGQGEFPDGQNQEQQEQQDQQRQQEQQETQNEMLEETDKVAI